MGDETDADTRTPEPEEKPSLFGFTNPSREELGKDKEAPKRRGRPPGSTSTAGLRTALEQQFTLLGMGLMMVNQYDGSVIVKNAEDCSKALADAAAQNPKLKKALERLMATGTFAQLSLAFAPVFIPIMANHGIVPIGMAALVTDDLPPLNQAPPAP